MSRRSPRISASGRVAVALAEEGLFGRAALYIALSVVLSVVGAYAGILGARHLVSLRAT